MRFVKPSVIFTVFVAKTNRVVALALVKAFCVDKVGIGLHWRHGFQFQSQPTANMIMCQQTTERNDNF